jgi:hypothetical protein
MIRILDIWSYTRLKDIDFKQIEQFREIFSNLEQFRLGNSDCSLTGLGHLLWIAQGVYFFPFFL